MKKSETHWQIIASILLTLIAFNGFAFLFWDGYYLLFERVFHVDVFTFRNIQVGLMVIGVAISLGVLRFYKQRYPD